MGHLFLCLIQYSLLSPISIHVQDLISNGVSQEYLTIIPQVQMGY